MSRNYNQNEDDEINYNSKISFEDLPLEILHQIVLHSISIPNDFISISLTNKKLSNTCRLLKPIFLPKFLTKIDKAFSTGPFIISQSFYSFPNHLKHGECETFIRILGEELVQKWWNATLFNHILMKE